MRASYFDETDRIVQHLTTLGVKKIAMFYQNDAYGKAGLEGVTRALTKREMKAVAAATVERNSVDVIKSLDDILKAAPKRWCKSPLTNQRSIYQTSAQPPNSGIVPWPGTPSGGIQQAPLAPMGQPQAGPAPMPWQLGELGHGKGYQGPGGIPNYTPSYAAPQQRQGMYGGQGMQGGWRGRYQQR